MNKDNQFHSQIYNALCSAAGKENVSDSEMVLVSYGFDSSPAPPGKPDFVVLARDTVSVKQVLEVANRARIPVTPLSGGVNVGGTAVPSQGGIVLDLKWMNKIIEINEDAAYAVIEAGVTFDELTAKLIEKGYRCSIPTSPGGSTPVGNSLMKPSGSLSNRQLDSFVGLEVVLPDGTIVRTGSGAFPFCGSYLRYGPYPDLTGLFCCAHGTLGVVTKAAIRIYPINESTKSRSSPLIVFRTLSILLMMFAGGISLSTVSFGTGISTKAMRSTFHLRMNCLYRCALCRPRAQRSKLPYNLVTVMMSGYKEDMEAHEKVLEKVSKAYAGRRPLQGGDRKQYSRAAQSWKSFYADYHIPAMDQTKKYGLGRYIPWIVTAEPKDVVSIEKEAVQFLDDLKVRPICYYSMPFDYGRGIFFRIFSWVNPQDRELLAKVGTLYQDMYKWAMKKYGATPFRHRRDPNILTMTGGYQILLRAIKKMVDPNNIMNPGVALF